MKREDLKIYAIKTQTETDWIAAASIIEALQTYCSTTDLDISDLHRTDTIEEIPVKRWGKHNIIDEYGNIEMTFAKWMETCSHSEIIASTAY